MGERAPGISMPSTFPTTNSDLAMTVIQRNGRESVIHLTHRGAKKKNIDWYHESRAERMRKKIIGVNFDLED